MVVWQGRQYADWKAARADMLTPTEAASVAVMDPPAEAPSENTPPAEDSGTRGPETAGGSEDRIVQAPARPVKRESLLARHRPRALAQVVGQPAAVAQLRTLAADPFPCALILAGATGTGKTSAAWALAADLGCDIDSRPPEFGGVYSIPSGEQNADALRELWPQLWNMPFQSARGWKVVIVNEVEQLNGTVERLWLDRLEDDMPPQTVIVFTTNALATLPDRFVDRCTVIEFDSSADKLTAAARALAASIWRAETGGEIPSDVLTEATDRAIVGGRVSFRRAVQAIAPMLAQRGQV